MFEPFGHFDPWEFEICFPGAVSGEAEVNCPHCGALVTVAVDDPLGSQAYACPECRTPFRVNWGA